MDLFVGRICRVAMRLPTRRQPESTSGLNHLAKGPGSQSSNTIAHFTTQKSQSARGQPRDISTPVQRAIFAAPRRLQTRPGSGREDRQPIDRTGTERALHNAAGAGQAAPAVGRAARRRLSRSSDLRRVRIAISSLVHSENFEIFEAPKSRFRPYLSLELTGLSDTV